MQVPIETAPRLAGGTPEQGLLSRLLWYGAAVGGVAAITLLMHVLRLQAHINPHRLQMAFLLLVLPLAIGGGRGPAIVACFLAFMSFDWFFVRPAHQHFLTGDIGEWFALGLLLAVGLSTGSLAAGLKRSVQEARRSARETATLYELSVAIMAGTTLEGVLGVVVDRLAASLGLRTATAWLTRPNGALNLLAISEPNQTIARLVGDDGGPLEAFAALSPLSSAELLPPQPVTRVLRVGESTAGLYGVYVPFSLNSRPLGVLAAYTDLADPPLSTEAWHVLNAFAAQTALAVGRIQLVEEEKRARAAIESDRLKSIFLASISHDLRTPLTAIKTSAALLLSEAVPAAGLDAALNIDREVDRLNHLVGNLLEMSRIESGATPPQLMLEDVAELVGVTAQRVTPLLDGHRLDLIAPENLPLIPIDSVQIGRVLTNLLENAIKFSPHGSVITLKLSIEESQLSIRIHNSGAPIPAEEQLHIFDKFHQVRRESQTIGGTGLGLAICKGIMEAHHGRIWTCNEEDGVSFYLSLPASQRHTAEPANLQAVML